MNAESVQFLKEKINYLQKSLPVCDYELNMVVYCCGGSETGF